MACLRRPPALLGRARAHSCHSMPTPASRPLTCSERARPHPPHCMPNLPAPRCPTEFMRRCCSARVIDAHFILSNALLALLENEPMKSSRRPQHCACRTFFLMHHFARSLSHVRRAQFLPRRKLVRSCALSLPTVRRTRFSALTRRALALSPARRRARCLQAGARSPTAMAFRTGVRRRCSASRVQEKSQEEVAAQLQIGREVLVSRGSRASHHPARISSCHSRPRLPSSRLQLPPSRPRLPPTPPPIPRFLPSTQVHNFGMIGPSSVHCVSETFAG